MLNKTIIIRNFSKSAHRYDEYAGIQRWAANLLIEEIPKKYFTRILELGCGTGIYTRLLKARFKDSGIKAIDISEKMIKAVRENIAAENMEFEVEDAEKITIKRKYDLITSSSAVQWFESIENTIKRCSDALTKNAWFIFSSFGPLTFKELAAALKDAQTNKEFFTASKNFLEKKELQKLLLKFFDKVSVKEILTQKQYPSLKNLLEHIKYTGSRGCLTGRVWSKNLFQSVEDAYLNKNGCIIATYQIFLCKAEK